MSIKTVLQSILPTLRIVQIGLETLDANDSGLDDAAAKQINGGIVAVQAYLDSFPADLAVRGYTAIKAYCDNVINSLNIVIASDLPKAEKIAQAQSLVDSLTDDSKVYPAKKGKDGDLLQKTIVQAKAKLEILKDG